MAYYFAEGSSIQFSQTFAGAKTVTVASNANPAVLTSVAHGYSTNDEVLFTSGWEDATDTVWKVNVLTADTFNLLGLAVIGALAPLFILRGRARLRLGLVAVLVLPVLGIWLLGGGMGLRLIETREWGGLMLTLFIAIHAGLIAVPAYAHILRVYPRASFTNVFPSWA
jgi:hypothetical protein